LAKVGESGHWDEESEETEETEEFEEYLQILGPISFSESSSV
jgi:hypothetical protein